jgi:formimidoylglutamate deiminase
MQPHWVSPAYVGVSPDGKVSYLSDTPPEWPCGIETVNGFALPGFQNAHSHAFQFAMAGMAEEHRPGTADDFWTWRETMYRCALSIDPDQLEAIATGLYAEMLRNGYTHVAEFHYLHHDQKGRHYANMAEMGERLVSAAKSAGIKITLVPVFYQQGSFGKAFEPNQKRFISSTTEDYLHLLDDSANAVFAYADARLGFGVHSLRAVNHRDIIETFNHGPSKIPFHIHAAEQEKEVSECRAHLGMRPVEWLLENMEVGSRFHIVHCTHMVDDELTGLAKTGASVVLCPGTEANLGDGIFRFTEFTARGGQWSQGTDSHISLNPLEDLRWLDYTQRLTTHRRNTFDHGASRLVRGSVTAGRRAMGEYEANDYFEIGKAFDAVVYSGTSPQLLGRTLEHTLATILYTADSSCIKGTMVNGNWVVRDQHHTNGESIINAFRKAIESMR